ncbi:hypothetical protein MOC18_18680, partial [Bacillus spizizenii]|nr:hypothetical protein [Bacillus spizizenii]
NTLKGMTHVMIWGCLPYFLYVLIRMFTN